MSDIGSGKEIDSKYWKTKGNRNTFKEENSRHENHPLWQEGYNYWKPIGETDYPTDPKQLEEAKQEQDTGFEEMEDDMDDSTTETADKLTIDFEEANEKVLYSCPEPGCTRQYQFYGRQISGTFILYLLLLMSIEALTIWQDIFKICFNQSAQTTMIKNVLFCF